MTARDHLIDAGARTLFAMFWIFVIALQTPADIGGIGAATVLAVGVFLGMMTEHALVAAAGPLGRGYSWAIIGVAEARGAVWRCRCVWLLTRDYPAGWSVRGAWRFSRAMWEAEFLFRLDGRAPRTPRQALGGD